MIEGGQTVFHDSMESFNNYIAPNSLVMTLANPPATGVLNSIPGINKVELLNGKTIRLHFDSSPEITEYLVKRSVADDWRLQEITLEKSSLDAIFAQLSNKKFISNS